MANFIKVTLDTVAPASPTLSIDGGATYTTDLMLDLAIGTGDGVTTGYQMKIWGADIDNANDVQVQNTEGASAWIPFAPTKAVRVIGGDGTKTVNIRLRDDVLNETGVITDTIILDTSLPTITVSGQDRTKISKIATKDKVSFSFTVDADYQEYKVKLVTSEGNAENTGYQIPVAGGSVNVSGTGAFTGATAINVTIDGDDLWTANSNSDGTDLILKVFVRDLAGLWST